MSKRNFILLIIVLIVILIAVFGFLYFRQNKITSEENQSENFFSKFNPFGNNKPTTTPPKIIPPVDVSGYEPPLTEEIQKVKLKKISSMPIAGFGVFVKERLKNIPAPEVQQGESLPKTPEETTTQTTQKPKTKPVKPTPPPTEFATALRYMEKAKGFIYQTFADKVEEKKFSTTVIPKAQEAYFGNKSESVVVRYLKPNNRTIETFVGNLPKEYLGADTTPKNEVKGSFLPENISDMSLSPDALKIFYLFNINDNNVIGVIFNLLDSKKVQIFDSVFTEWLPFWPNAKMITLTTKPSAGVPGYMYAIDLNNKNLNRILSGINGLTTLTSPNGKSVLYGDNGLFLRIYNTDTKDLKLMGVKTLPEKCVWGKISDTIYCAVPKLIDIGTYPDSWYQGEVSFSDQLWKIDAKNGNAVMISDPITVMGGEEIDGIKLALDEKEDYLFFVNKKDSFLWKLNLR